MPPGDIDPTPATPPNAALDLRDAADALGVHYQTVYRWVRSGRLPAALVGGKYLVEPQGIERIRQERSTPTPPRPPGPARVAREADAMHTAHVEGDDVGARRIARTLVDDGLAVVELIEHVLAPALRRIGQAWHEGRLTIWVEHRASMLTERILADVSPTPHGRRRGTAMVAAVSGDRHSLPTTMAAVALRSANWTVHHLGADMPPAELSRFCTEHDVDVAVLSCTNPDVADVVDATAADIETVGVPTIVGRPGARLGDLVELASQRRRG